MINAGTSILSMSSRQSVNQVDTAQIDVYGDMFVASCQLCRNASSLIRVPRFSSALKKFCRSR